MDTELGLCESRSLTTEYLVEEDFDVVGRQVLRRHDDFVEITLHQLRQDVAVRRWVIQSRKHLEIQEITLKMYLVRFEEVGARRFSRR